MGHSVQGGKNMRFMVQNAQHFLCHSDRTKLGTKLKSHNLSWQCGCWRGQGISVWNDPYLREGICGILKQSEGYFLYNEKNEKGIFGV